MAIKKTWIVMLYQANKPNNVIRVSEHSTKGKATMYLNRMISSDWGRSVVENTYRFGDVIATVVEAEIVETVQ